MQRRTLCLPDAQFLARGARPSLWMSGLLPMLLLATSGCTGTPADDGLQTTNAAEETAKVSHASTSSDKVPPEVHELANLAKDLVGAYPYASGALAVTTTFLRLFDIIASTDPLEEQLGELHDHIDRGFSAIDWKQSRALSETRLAILLSSLEGAHQAVVSGTPLVHNENVDSDSRTAVYGAEMPHAFMRYFHEDATAGYIARPPWSPTVFPEIVGSEQYWFHYKYLREVSWKDIIPDRPVVEGGNVYDWRIGVPAFMLDISLRLQVIAAVDPNFQTTQVFNTELAKYHDALAREHARMRDGVRCNVLGSPGVINYLPPQTVFVVACADIYTGDSNIAFFRYVDFEGDVNNRIEVAQALLSMRDEILGRLPLTQMEEMMTSLNQLRTPPRPSADRPNGDPNRPRLPSFPR